MGGRELGLTRGLSSARKFFENLILFLKLNTRDKSRILGTGWVFLSERSWGAGDQGVRCVKTEDQGYCVPGVQGNFPKI